MDDQNKTFRTRLVSVWMLSNAVLAVAIQNINGVQTVADAEQDEEELRAKQNLYFAIILYSTFGLSMVRFIGVSFKFHTFTFSWNERLRDVSTFSAFTTGLEGTCSDGAGGTKRRREEQRICDLTKTAYGQRHHIFLPLYMPRL